MNIHNYQLSLSVISPEGAKDIYSLIKRDCSLSLPSSDSFLPCRSDTSQSSLPHLYPPSLPLSPSLPYHSLYPPLVCRKQIKINMRR